jgi:hypothetical protein
LHVPSTRTVGKQASRLEDRRPTRAGGYDWERLSRFFGTLFLINFAIGVMTGIVQEFQFGMNWSN